MYFQQICYKRLGFGCLLQWFDFFLILLDGKQR